MTRLVISSRDAERIAKSFDDMLSAKGLNAVRRRAVNEIGSGLRKKTRAVAPGLYGTTAAALMIQGQSASPGSDDPEYRLRMATSVPVRRLRASSRKAKLQGGRLQLTLDTPALDRPIVFQSAKREGRGFSLLPAGLLFARGVGGVRTRARSAFGRPEEGGHAELAKLRRRAARDLPDAVARQIRKALTKR